MNWSQRQIISGYIYTATRGVIVSRVGLASFNLAKKSSEDSVAQFPVQVVQARLEPWVRTHVARPHQNLCYHVLTAIFSDAS